MKDKQKIFDKIRKLESQLSYASPPKAAKIVGQLVRLKATVFDE